MTAEERARAQAKELRGFIQHLGVFVAFGVFIFLINFLSRGDGGGWWFFWPLLPWGVGLAFHAWSTFNMYVFDDAWEDRHVARRLARERQPAPAAPVEPTAGSEIEQITARAASLIDGMRASARQVPKPDVRRQALEVCAAADQVLSAIADNPEEVAIARDFLNRYLTPAHTIMTDYTRLAVRNVPSAQPTLAKVEEHDLPLLTSKLHELYDRLHRGSLIDLEVAREMLSLDMADWGLEEVAPEGEASPVRRSDRPAIPG